MASSLLWCNQILKWNAFMSTLNINCTCKSLRLFSDIPQKHSYINLQRFNKVIIWTFWVIVSGMKDIATKPAATLVANISCNKSSKPWIWHLRIYRLNTNFRRPTRHESIAPDPPEHAQGYWRHTVRCTVRPLRGHKWWAVWVSHSSQRNRKWCNQLGLSGCFLECYRDNNVV